MTFLAPLFLIAAAAGAIPVLLHMIHRRRAKELPFPTLRFLRISVEKTRRRRRIQDLALMLLRAAALVLVAAGLARPTVTGLSSLWGAGAGSAAVVVLDNSASMAAVDADRPRLEAARAAARQILDQMGERDEVTLLITGGPPPADPPRLDRNQERIRQRLAACRPSYELADLATQIDRARELLARSTAANKHIYVLTDMQARSWESGAGPSATGSASATSRGATAEPPGATAGLPGIAEESGVPGPKRSGDPDVTTGSPTSAAADTIPIILVDCHTTPKPNVAVTDVRLAAALPIAGLPVKASVEVFNASSIAQQRHVELVLDGAKQNTSPAIDLPPGGRARHEFLFDFAKGGLHRGEARLVGRDGLAADDRRWFAKTVDPALAVSIVRGRKHEIPYLDDAFYLQQALSPGESAGSAIRATTLDAAALADEPLSDYRVVFCVNVPAPGDVAAARLARYVADGGNLVWICGDRVDPEAYNRMNAAAGGTLLPGKLLELRTPEADSGRDAWNVALLDKTHPALADLAEPASLYQSILVYRHVRFDPSETPGVRVLARLDDGEPLLAQRDVGPGHVVFLGTSCHVDWTNLPVRPIFLPMLLRLTYELAGTSGTERELLAGAPLVLPADRPPWNAGVEIQRPSGERIRRGASGATAGASSATAGSPSSADTTASPVPAELRYPDTHDPGIYLVRPLTAASSEPLAVVVNMDPDESDPRTITRDELTSRLGNSPLVLVDHPDNLPEVFKKLREGHSLWTPFLSGVLILLVFETFLANRFVPKKA